MDRLSIMPCLLKNICRFNRQVFIQFESHHLGWKGKDFFARKFCGVRDRGMNCL